MFVFVCLCVGICGYLNLCLSFMSVWMRVHRCLCLCVSSLVCLSVFVCMNVCVREYFNLLICHFDLSFLNVLLLICHFDLSWFLLVCIYIMSLFLFRPTCVRRRMRTVLSGPCCSHRVGFCSCTFSATGWLIESANGPLALKDMRRIMEYNSKYTIRE